MPLLETLLLGLALHLPAGACPAENEDARAKVNRFLTSSTFAGERQKYGIPSVSSPVVRVLTDAQDVAVCQRLAAMVKVPAGRHPKTTVYYESGGFYFVSTVRVLPPGVLTTGFLPLDIFRGDFSYVHSYAM